MYVCRWRELRFLVSTKKQQLHTAFGIQDYSEDVKETMVRMYVCTYVCMYVQCCTYVCVIVHVLVHTQTLIAEKAALLNIDDGSDLSNVLHRQRRLVSVEREIIAITDKVCMYYMHCVICMYCNVSSPGCGIFMYIRSINIHTLKLLLLLKLVIFTLKIHCSCLEYLGTVGN